MRSYDVGESRIDDGLEGGSLRRGDVRALRELRHVENVLVERRDVPVAGQRDRGVGVLRQPPGRRVAQRGEPRQLVVEVRVAEGATVRDVQRPDPDAAARSPHGTRLRCQRVAEVGHPREPVLDVVETDPRGDGDAVPLAVAECGDLVAHRLETH
jgi:hypothetical protein